MSIRTHALLRTLLAAAALAACAASSALAQDNTKPSIEVPPPVPEDAQQAVANAEATGQLLYRHDRAAWLATDAMLAERRMHILKARLGGWVTEAANSGIRVIFYSRDDVPVRLFEIEVDAGERLSEPVIESTEPLSATHLAQIKARDLAVAQEFMTCARKYNSVALPSGNGMRVYLMPGFVEHGVYPLGGYHRYDIDVAGEKVLGARGFSKSCIDHRDAPKGIPDGGKPAFGMFTHLLDSQPTEIHVFVSLHATLPMMILTTDNKRVWSVKNGRISFVDNMD